MPSFIVTLPVSDLVGLFFLLLILMVIVIQTLHDEWIRWRSRRTPSNKKGRAR